MTTVPVLWCSRHPEVLARGYADQGLLEALLDRSLWRPPAPIEWEHVEATGTQRWGVDDFEVTGGAVVIVPFRHHSSEDDVAWLGECLDALPWAVVMLTSDEEWLGDWAQLLAPNRRLWVWQGRPEHAAAGCRLMPCGWYQDRPDVATGERTDRALTDELARERMLAKPLDWAYGGQVTHERKEACVKVLRGMHLSTRGELIETDRYFDQPLSLHDYLAWEAGAKVVPCPSGPVSLCTARVEEALEAGAVPVVDLVKPGDVPQNDYWSLVFPGYPFPALYSWADFPRVLAEVLDDWPAIANRCSAFWARWKRDKAQRLDDDIRELMEAYG